MGLLVVRTFGFTCDAITDGLQCVAYIDQFAPPIGERKPLAWARKVARQAGWKHIGHRSYCPKHEWLTGIELNAEQLEFNLEE